MGEIKEWTLMFYFASDNPLAPGIVSQLKSIKQAGFHPEANVVAHFDPETVGTPTHIFDVNLINKRKNPGLANIGFCNDPFVRNMLEDKLWRNQKDRHGQLVRNQMRESLKAFYAKYDPPIPPDGRSTRRVARNGRRQEAGPKQSLASFLKFCGKNYRAKHYMLFILGHGLVVGNDVFLFDEHADESSLSLRDLGLELRKFTRQVNKQGGQFELVSFHSCSVSSLEVAYELRNTAKYMLASQGPAFVGSWPYRQILLSIFSNLVQQAKDKKKIDVKEMVNQIFDFCLYNSMDFMLAGYSFDLCLCNLSKVEDIKKPLRKLSNLLAESLQPELDTLFKDYMLLAHLKAQSYWQESYTDLYDFCFCLSLQCLEGLARIEKGPTYTRLAAISTACNDVMDVLQKETGETGDMLVVRSESAGPASQYSHGLSVFFPWSEPSSDNPIWSKEPDAGQYEHYKFEQTKWRTFLQNYFDNTMRKTHKDESPLDGRERRMEAESTDDLLLEDIVNLIFNEEGQLSMGDTLSGPKTSPPDPTGDDCTCASVKNFPRDTRVSHVKRRRAPNEKEKQKPIPLSPTFDPGFLKDS